MIFFNHIKIKNFRAYEDVSINFDANAGVILMHGDNGSGKSTLLNAINWCLYGDTPFYTTTKVTAVLNKHAPQGTKAEVELIASIEDKKYRFFRVADSDIGHGGILEVSFETNGNWTVLDGASSGDAVRRILPKDIRHLFFFNGERLKDIFTQNNEHDLKSSVYKVAELNVIDNSIKYLKSVENTYLKQIGKISRNSLKIKQLKEAKEVFEKQLKDFDDTLANYMEEKRRLKTQVAELDEIIRNTALARQYIAQRDTVKERIQETEDKLKSAYEDQRQIIQENYHKLILQIQTQDYKKALEKASKEGSIPPPISPEVTSRILSSKTCICGRHIGHDEEIYIQKQHNDYEEKEGLRFLTDGILTFSNLDNKIKEMKYKMLDTIDVIQGSTIKKKELQEELRKINEVLDSIDEANLHDNPEARRTKIENKISNLDILIGGAGSDKRDLQDRLLEVDKELRKNISEDDSTKDLERKRILAENLQKHLLEVKLTMESSIRKKLEKSVWQTFSKILPDNNYESIEIDQNYNLTLIANDGTQYPTNVLATGQTKALGLSLAYGLSKDLGYSDIPLLIDNLYGDLSDQHFEDLTDVISSLAKHKQIIIMDLNIDKTSNFFSSTVLKQRFLIKRSSKDNKTVIEEL